MAIRQRAEKKPLGIYIHVPFCRSKCVYCDFYSITNKDDKLLDAYLNAICTHIKETGPLAPNYHVDTIYFGGGTPSFFGADGMIAILTAIRKSFHVDLRAEITFEANPDSISPRLLRRLKSEGFNRVSLGVQCDNDEILKKLGRPHNFEQVVNAVKRIRRAGYKNLSLDLIYGLPGQTLESWEKTLENVIALKPEHMSCYGLKVEEGTPLYQYQEYMDLPDDDTQADMYLSAVNILRRNGFRQYEISNFAQRGYPSAHNLKYWMGGEYLGFGPDASSDFAGKRFSIVRSLRDYADGIHNGGQVLREMQEILPRERAGEYIMLRLRTTAGISREEFERRFLLSFDPLAKAMDRFCLRNWAMSNGKGGYRLTPDGFLVSNTIINELLDAQDECQRLGNWL
jgi:oxygen-independent coproporphyrinogen-3 oxidase